MQSIVLSITVIRSCKCVKVSRDDVVEVSDSAIQSKNKLNHEHEFTTRRIKETNNFLVNCITCGIYYCDLCGKAL
jgi:hypothetical protein